MRDGGRGEEGAEVGRVRQPHGAGLARWTLGLRLGGWDPLLVCSLAFLFRAAAPHKKFQNLDLNSQAFRDLVSRAAATWETCGVRAADWWGHMLPPFLVPLAVDTF